MASSNSNMQFTITGDASSALGVLNSFGSSVKGMTGQVESSFASVTRSIQGMLAPIMAVTAILGGGALFGGAISGAIEFQKEIGGIQRVMGTTAKEATVTAIAVKSVFGSVDNYDNAAAKLVKTLNTNESAITSLGIKTRDSKGHFRDMADLLPEVVQRLGEFQAGTDRDSAAQTIFGRSFKDVLVFAKMTPQVMDEARQRAHAMGLELDGQARGTVLHYRQSMEGLDVAFLGMKTRVALEVMPALTSMGNWMTEVAPAAINGVGTLLGGLRDMLSYTTVQAVLLLGVLRSLTSIRIVAAGWDNLRLIGLYAMDGAAGLRVLGSAALSFVGVAGVAIAAFGAYFFAIERLATAEGRRHDQSMKEIHAATDQAASLKELQERYAEIAKELDSGTLKGKEKTEALRKLKTIEGEIIATAPEYREVLAQEKGSYVAMAEAIRAVNAEKVKNLETRKAALELALKEAEAQEARLGDTTPTNPNNPYDKSPAEGEMGQVLVNTVGLGQAQARVRNLRAEVDALTADLKKLNAPKPPEPPRLPNDASPTANTNQAGMNRLIDEGIALRSKATLAEQESNAEAKVTQHLIEERERIQKERKAGSLTSAQAKAQEALAEQNYMQGMINAEADFATQRAQLEEQLQGQLTASEEGGLAKRLEAIRATYVKIRQENAKLAQDGKTPFSEEQIKAAQAAAEARAQTEQVKADLSRLKAELTELAQTKGGVLSSQDRDGVLARYDAQGGTNAQAASKYRQENHVGAGGGAGIKAGIDGYLATAQDSFKVFETMATSILSGVENAFGSFFTSLTQRGSTFGEKTKALWMGISGAVVQSLGKMAAQLVVNWAIEKAKLAWDWIASAWHTTDTTKTVTENTTKAASNTTVAVTGVAAANASMGPWGWVAAIAGIVALLAFIGSVTAHATGGLVTKPELALIGEAGPELIAPESDFKDWAASLSGQSWDLGHAIARADAQARGYDRNATDYTSGAASSENVGGGQTIVVQMAGAHIYDQRAFGKVLIDTIQASSRSTNVVISPGGTLGGRR